MFLGFVQLEGTLLLSQLTKNGDLPANADANPTYRIYGIVNGSIALMSNGTGNIAISDQTGLYQTTKTIPASDGYAAGQEYVVLVSYSVSSASKGELHTFCVV